MKKIIFYILILACLISILYQEYKPLEYVEAQLGDAETVQAKKIVTTLEGKTKEEVADIKATELAKIDALPKEEIAFADTSYELEVLDIQKIDGGVETFIRAWEPKGEQRGFGDGTVDIERVIIKNPPILVPDPAGDIVRTTFDQNGNPRETRFREDPELALKQVLTSVVKNHSKDGDSIVPNKVGNTVYTDYPSMDGYVRRSGADGTNDLTWTAARDTADGTGANTSDASTYTFAELRTSPNRYEISRVFYIFDTSDIPDTDNIDSATFTAYSEGDDINIAAYGLIQTSPASDSSLAVGDYDAMTINSPDEGAARVTPSGTSGAANTWTLNATGLTWINKTGNTRLGLRHANDIDNVTPGARTYWNTYMVDVVGTSIDPILSVTTSEGAPAEATVYPLSTFSGDLTIDGSVIIKP